MIQDSKTFSYGAEATFGTPVTPDHALEALGSSKFGWTPERKQGEGLRVGGYFPRSGRRVETSGAGEGNLDLEALSKGQLLLWKAMMGASTSTLVSGTTHQHVFTRNVGILPSLTIQAAKQLINGTVVPETFSGCVCADWELTFDAQEIIQLKSNWDVQSVSTAAPYAAPAYPAEANLFTFVGCTLFQGTVTPPTDIALATALTPLATIRKGSIAVNNGILTDRYLAGGGGRKAQQLPGAPSGTVKLTAEYATTALRDAFMADTPMTLVANFTAGSLSTGLETLQVVISEMRPDGDLADGDGGGVLTQEMEFTILDNLQAAQAIWVVARSSEATL